MNRREKYCASLLAFVLLFAIASSCRSAEQYKNQTRNAIAKIVDGKFGAAIKDMAKYLENNPGDAESLYGLTVAHAQKQDIAKAIDYLKQALDAGLPFNRFIAGPRDLLEPLTESDEFKALAGKHGSELIHGRKILGPHRRRDTRESPCDQRRDEGAVPGECQGQDKRKAGLHHDTGYRRS